MIHQYEAPDAPSLSMKPSKNNYLQTTKQYLTSLFKLAKHSSTSTESSTSNK